MVGCNSKFGIGKCVCEMSDEELCAYECDIAEVCNFDGEEILRICKEAERIN